MQTLASDIGGTGLKASVLDAPAASELEAQNHVHGKIFH